MTTSATAPLACSSMPMGRFLTVALLCLPERGSPDRA
jgi:hypothetical protein